MFSYDFKLEKNDKNIGTIYLPNINSEKLPVKIYCHGWKGRRNLWTPTEFLCRIAMSNNIALITFDFFGCGETGGDFGLDFCRYVVSNAPIHTINKIKGPVLFLQGMCDNIYRITDAQIAYKIIDPNGGDVQHIEIPNGTHELENVIDDAMKYMFNWLLPKLK